MKILKAVGLAATLALAACAHEGGAYVPAASGMESAEFSSFARGAASAYGWVDSDPAGMPLSAIPVKLYPWVACVKRSKTRRSCPASIYSTSTNGKGEFRFASVKPGHYLLVIGSDDAADLRQATVHDQVTLAAGSNPLKAPTLPKEPVAAPFSIRVPKIERSGHYRLLALNKWERLCAKAFLTLRTERHLPPFVVDEWLTENTRTVAAYFATLKPCCPGKYHVISLGAGRDAIGGNDCTELANISLADPEVTDPRALWLGAIWKPFDNGGEAAAGSEFPLDPRSSPTGTYPPFPAWL